MDYYKTMTVLAEFHAWIEQHFTITDRYTVQHGTASLQVLVVG